MSKKDYIKFAAMIKARRDELEEVINDLEKPENVRTWVSWQKVENTRMAELTADIFEDENPRFDRDRFLKACGVE